MENEEIIVQDVETAQLWLNQKFENYVGWVHVEPDGVAGYNTMVAFVRALQILLGIDVDGGFGNGTKQAFNSLFPNGLGEDTVLNNTTEVIVGLINVALLCRIEISNIENIYEFSNATRQGITSTMDQLGIENFTSNLTAREVKALFTSDAYYLVSNGDATTREIQQAINRKYSNILDNYIATNGIYERNMNTALIKMIQYEIGTDVDGGWGEGTMSSLPVLGPGSSRTNLVYILQYLLYLNGFDPNGFDGGFGNGVTTALKNFQTLMKLDVDGYCGRQAWSALVVSCGDTSRSANACDTCFEITPARAQLLKNNGFEVVGRYLTGYLGEDRPKALQDGELQTILNAGLKAFVIYQENNRQISDFSFYKGFQAAGNALFAAIENKIPQGTIIYFAVDMDVYEDQINDYIIPFFEGINRGMSKNIYKVGVYGPRLVCSRLADAGLAVSSFVADMSSGYSCNIGQKMPDNWCYDQFKEISNYNNELDIDKVTYSGNIEAISSIGEFQEPVEIRNRDTLLYIEAIYDVAEKYLLNKNPSQATVSQINKLVLQYIAYSEYNELTWNILVGYDIDAMVYINTEMAKNGYEDKRRTAKLYSKDYNQEISLPHLAVSTYMIFSRIGLLKTDAIVADLCSWAGDLLNFASDVNKAIPVGQEPSDLAEQIKNQILSSAETSFGIEDFMQDIDAWNIYDDLNRVRIYQVLYEYYNSDTTSRVRKFVENRVKFGHLPSGVDNTTSEILVIQKLAMEYLDMDISNLTGLAATAFDILRDFEVPRQSIRLDIATGFTNKAISFINL